jgi:hypothetical protein
MIAGVACAVMVLGGVLSATHGIAGTQGGSAQTVASDDRDGAHGPHAGFNGHACIVHAGCSTSVPAGLSTNAWFAPWHEVDGKALWRPDRQNVLVSHATRPPTPPPKAAVRT